MFRNLLLVTTALLAVTSITPTEAQNVAGANASHAAALHLASAVAAHRLDKNTEFLCAYGGYDVYGFASSSFGPSSGSFESGWKHVAVPISGHGRAVGTIVVQNGNGLGSGRFVHAGIYSNTPSGTPGNLIASGKSKADHLCKRRDVSIPSTVLDDGEKYWVVESVSPPRFRDKNSVTWAMDPVARDDAYSQYHTFGLSDVSGSRHSYSYTSPWKRINGRAPFVRVK